MELRHWFTGWLAWTLLTGTPTRAQKPPLLPGKDVAALANELSGETAKRNLEGIARFHRQRGSAGFHAAAELVAERLRAYGLSDVAILQFPADGKIFYGTQRSRPAWDAETGELTESDSEPARCDKEKVENRKESFQTNCAATNLPLIGSFESEPVVLAEESESADVTAGLVDAGEGTKESDYAGKAVKGKIVLVGAQPGAVQDLAVGKYGAAGIVSYAQNQKTAWSGENENLVRWGHLETFSPNKTFAFMVSLKMARSFRERLANGEQIQLHALVKAGQSPGAYEIATATIPGVDPQLMEEEVVYSCHLDHQRPGANDNASGCVTILEVARTLQKLIREAKLRTPLRTIRFVFPPEVEGTMAMLTNTGDEKVTAVAPTKPGVAESTVEMSPELRRALQSSDVTAFPFGKYYAARVKAVIHMDMVGGGPETKAVFHVTRGPLSLPSFVHDVAWSFAEWVNQESYKFAATGSAEYPLVAPEGGKEPLRAEFSAYTMGSDHDVYQDSSFGIPTIYLNDWPDRYIHTNFDTAANIDTTKLKRAAFIGAASGYFLANMASENYPDLLDVVKTNQYFRSGEAMRRSAQLTEPEKTKLLEQFTSGERALASSIDKFARVSLTGSETQPPILLANKSLQGKLRMPTNEAALVFKRTGESKGPMTVFGWDYFLDNLKTSGVAAPKLLNYEGLWGSGEEYAYEALNFVNGLRNAQEIRDAVSAEYGPVPRELVVEYLKALEKIGVVAEAK